MPGQAVRQAAAIPLRNGRVGLVTSTGGKRWVVPKGMIDPGHTAAEAALIEAWEEAGFIGTVSTEPIGTYNYKKYDRTYHVTVFVMQVTDVENDWPERFRRREWLSVETACLRIREPGLRELIREAAVRAEELASTHH